MKKLILITALSFLVLIPTFGGGLLTNTNQHILFLRNPARNASMEIDALYSNPAGIAFMAEGFHLSLNIQSAYQTRTIHSTFQPFVGFGGDETKKYKGEASAPVVPSIYAVYKKDKWAFGAHFAVTGGGGKATFNNGLGSFESQVATIPALLNKEGIPTSRYSMDSYMKGKQMIFGLQIGAAYQITENLSAYGGLRMNLVNNSYFGYVRNIEINPTLPALGYDGTIMVSAEKFFNQIGRADLEKQVMDQNLDCDQSGWGVTPIIGVDFKTGKWNFGAKYEFNTHLNVENKRKYDDPGIFEEKFDAHDIPSLLSLGASYEILPVLRASVGYHHFFDKNAKMAGDKQKELTRGTHEFMGGIEWDIHRIIQVSGGMQRTSYGIGDGFQNDMSFSISSYTFGFGAGINLSPKMKLNIAYFWTNYEDYTKETANYNGTNIPGKDVFSRTNKVFGIGLDYKF